MRIRVHIWFAHWKFAAEAEYRRRRRYSAFPALGGVFHQNALGGVFRKDALGEVFRKDALGESIYWVG